MLKHLKSHQGFTLMEVLIVVAIIAILLSISIPVFGSQLEKTRAATCASNCRSLKGLLSVSYMLEDVSEDEINAIKLNKANEYTYENEQYSCPNGGEITAKCENGSLTVSCSYHGNLNEGSTGSFTNADANKLWDAINDFNKNDIDSTSNGEWYKALLVILKDKGLDLDTLGAISWHIKTDMFGKFFEWTTVDVNTLTAGATIPVIRYRLGGGSSTAYDNLYSVWKAKVIDKGSYKIFTADTEYTESGRIPDKEDIQKVVTVYNKYADDQKLPLLP